MLWINWRNYKYTDIYYMTDCQSLEDEGATGLPAKNADRRLGTLHQLPPRWSEHRDSSVHVRLSGSREWFRHFFSLFRLETAFRAEEARRGGHGQQYSHAEHRAEGGRAFAHVPDVAIGLWQWTRASQLRQRQEEFVAQLARSAYQARHRGGARARDARGNVAAAAAAATSRRRQREWRYGREWLHVWFGRGVAREHEAHVRRQKASRCVDPGFDAARSDRGRNALRIQRGTVHRLLPAARRHVGEFHACLGIDTKILRNQERPPLQYQSRAETVAELQLGSRGREDSFLETGTRDLYSKDTECLISTIWCCIFMLHAKLYGKLNFLKFNFFFYFFYNSFQSLLITIGDIIASHSPYKRSYDSHFKAFICAALKWVIYHSVNIWTTIAEAFSKLNYLLINSRKFIFQREQTCDMAEANFTMSVPSGKLLSLMELCCKNRCVKDV